MRTVFSACYRNIDVVGGKNVVPHTLDSTVKQGLFDFGKWSDGHHLVYLLHCAVKVFVSS